MSQYYYQTPSAPVSVPKQQATYPYPYPYQTAYARLSESPPEPAASSSGSGVASYDHSGASTYASSDYASSESANSVDLLEYMNNRLAATYNPVPLDKSLARQAQAQVSPSPQQSYKANIKSRSGEMNAKTRQLMELQALAQQRLQAAQASFGEGIKTAKEVQRDLQWSQKKVQ